MVGTAIKEESWRTKPEYENLTMSELILFFLLKTSAVRKKLQDEAYLYSSSVVLFFLCIF